MGTVEYVGLKTTRIRALSGEQIVVSNTDLLKHPVRNFRRMQERRIVFNFGLAYGTAPDHVEAVPGIVRRLVDADTGLGFDRAHFLKFGDSSLDFEVVYIVLSPAYNVYMDARQRLNLGLMREFAARGIGFALPIRSINLLQDGAPARFAASRDQVA